MTEADTFERTVKVVRETFRLTDEPVTRASTADEVPGWDSLAHAVFLMNVERAFGIRFDPQEVLELENVGALVDIITAKLR